MADWVGAIGAVGGLGSAAGFVVWGYPYFKAELMEDQEYRKRISQQLISHDYIQGYRTRLSDGLNTLSFWMGDLYTLRGTLKGMSICFAIAMAYSVFFFFISWVFDGPAGLGQIEILPQATAWQRMFWTLGVLVALVFLGSMARRSLSGSILLALSLAAIFVQISYQFIPQASILCLALIGAFFILSANANGLKVMQERLGWGSSNMASLIFLFLGSGLLVGLIQLIWQSASRAAFDSQELVVLLFCFALPALNMILDWPSWWISRRLGHNLLERISNQRKQTSLVVVIGAHAIIDLALAVICLGLLAMIMSFVVDLFNLRIAAITDSQPLELRPFIAEAVRTPWPNAIWVGLMLISTLVPTLLHAGLLVATPLTLWLVPNERRHLMAIELAMNDKPHPSTIRSASWHLVRFWLIAIISPVLMLIGFYLLANSLFAGLNGWSIVDLILKASDIGMCGAAFLARSIGW